MTYDRILALAGNWAAILTAIVAVFAYGAYLWNRRERRLRLEQHLKGQKALRLGKGQRTVLHLMRHLRMTESEVLEAAFHSRLVQLSTDQDPQGRSINLWFEYGEFDDGSDDLLCKR